MPQKSETIILGIDPGTNLMGYGVIRTPVSGTGKGRGRSGSGGNMPEFLDMGVVDLKKNNDPYIKLGLILGKTLELIDRFLPDEVAIEAPFFGKNVQSMLKLGRAQGVAIAAVLSRQIPVAEYAPRKIKLAIAGAGDASKEQVAGMLARMFSFKEIPNSLDATDGLAVAVCHFYQKGQVSGKTRTGSWEDFIRKNPDRVR